MTRDRMLVVGASGSAAMLVVLGALQMLRSPILDLPAHWLAVAVLPLFVALVAGRYITRLEGFGVALEAALGAPVATVDLRAADAIADVPGDEKQSLEHLRRMSADERRAIRWLAFRVGRRDYYRPHAIAEYVFQLPNVTFFELRGQRGELVGFQPASVMRQPTGEPDMAAIERFVDALERDDRAALEDGAVTLEVTSSASVVDVLARMRAQNAEFAAVLSPEGRYLGVVLARDVERRIADTVLSTAR